MVAGTSIVGLAEDVEFPDRATRFVPLERVFVALRLVFEESGASEVCPNMGVFDPKVKVLRTGGLKAWSFGSSLRSLANDS